MTDLPADVPRGDPLDLYLDGLLKGDALAQFEKRLGADPALRAMVEHQRSIDERIRTEYRPPARIIAVPTPETAVKSGPAPKQAEPAATSARSFKFPIAPRYLAYAAVIALAALGFWQFQGMNAKRPGKLSAGGVFSRLTSTGFKPEFVCTTDKDFNDTMQKRFGQGLLIASAPNIELVGWAYSTGYSASVISKDELILMARVDGKEALVFMDKKDHEPGWGPFRGIEEYAPKGMNVFRGEVGTMVLYELSASDKPLLISRAYIPK